VCVCGVCSVPTTVASVAMPRDTDEACDVGNGSNIDRIPENASARVCTRATTVAAAQLPCVHAGVCTRTAIARLERLSMGKDVESREANDAPCVGG
jgi:hypothetical protein